LLISSSEIGKSSLFAALFRTTDLFSGSILIDGVEIHQVPLERLRSSICIIPQQPILFSGTLRDNVDPFHQYSDEMIWEVLDKCHLRDTVQSFPQGLETEITEKGGNFSLGQRQLFCLARALLIRARILCIDEATASVDVQTDALIQRTIQEEFRDCTVLTIAHRINTISNSDKILVMEKGMVKEFDTADNLLKRDSVFASLMRESQFKAS
jgi:ABC-type multidrug transport system fused ATPase/permease subunit